MKRLVWMTWGLAWMAGGSALVFGCDSASSAEFAGDGYGYAYADEDYFLDPDDGDPSSMGGAAQVEPVGTNPFVVVGHDPLSTFGADVDTASYEYFRNNVENGYLPPADSVRLEEFVNYFDYDYPAPATDAPEPFAIHLEASPNLVDRETTVLRVGIQGKVVPPGQKKPASLVFLVDVSGSMSEELSLVQEMLRGTVELLEETDTIAIVTYAGAAGTVLPATPVSEKGTILAKIDQLVSGGSTNGAGGINAAYAEAEGAFLEDGINHVILCTDGDFNVGVSSTDELEELIVEKRKTGVTLTVVGFGSGNVNDAMMERISNSGNGIYGYVGSEADAEEYVSERMLQTIVHIAKDVKLQVEFNPAHVYAYRLLGYENRAIADEDFRDDVVDAGEIGSGHRVTALYELVLTEGDLPSAEEAPALDDGAAYDGPVEVSPSDLVLVKVRYKLPGATETDPASEVATSLSPTAVHEGFSDGGSDLQWAVAVASFAEIVKESPYADRAVLSQVEAIVSSQASRDDERAEFKALVSTTKGLLGL
jgi:Ca-activated chloride channel homolog